MAARFTLDAMPGKQMAIDADEFGLIDERQAIAKKRNTARGGFYGAMDGASKFVKGDAIVGILIVIIDIIGGIIIGSRDMPLEEVLETYSILTVGDGLVSQIPALLISTASGIIVTRAASDSNLGRDLLKQITGQPIVLLLAGAMLLVMGLFPGFPKWVLFPLGGIFIYLGYTLVKAGDGSEETQSEETMAQQEIEEIRNPENVIELLQVDPIELVFGFGIIPLADVNQGGDLLDRVVMIRRQMALDLGLIVPLFV